MNIHRLTPLVIALALGASITTHAAAEDWGVYSIVPVSMQAMVLEAVDSGRAEGTIVSINKPAGGANQKWIVTSREDSYFTIKPAHDPSLVLAAAKGGAKQGAQIVLEKDGGQPWQLWALTKLENGSYGLTPKHAPALGLDHLGGKQTPGAKIDLWTRRENDQHLQWFIKPLAGTGVAAALAADDAKKYEPPAIKPEDILPGVTKQFQFTQSKIFPGTVRDVTVFIPAQYDGKKPACVYVKTDGFNPREKALLETMIATKEMPVTVGVFVRPGDLPAPMKAHGRRNRCFEYDGVSDNNVRFLIEELLPFVAKEFGLNLSTDGNDRCMSGGSSGGIAAFTAAWNRPEAFSRVYAASGSWVAFRGGHEFPTMVRKFEAKPIRAFLTTATRDMENAAGDWFLLDQEMDKALKFSGYDYQFRIIDGRHVAGYAEHWQEAMAYLWRSWPERVKAGPSAPRAQEIIIPGEGWQLVAEGFKSTRGPACNTSGEVFFADTSNNKIHRIDLDGKVSEFVADAGQAHCVTVAADGTLFAISEKSGKLMRYDAAGKGSVVMDDILGHSILARPDGGLYVTDNDDKKPNNGGTVWFIKDGKKTRVDSGVKFATGMAYRPDQWLLSVAEGHSKWVYSYQINDDGTLTNKERFFHLYVADWDDDAGAECVCYSLEGRQFIATRSGVQISADDGPTQVILPVPDRSRVTGVCLGGKDKDTLFAFCGNKIWKRKVQHHAMGAFTPWTKASGTKL
ncbi:MAG: RICIN domain-containing protein [Verrucomicrobia bacterium]|nr:RICIN domain-containing protein [Verrucomicrobiota bacterium]